MAYANENFRSEKNLQFHRRRRTDNTRQKYFFLTCRKFAFQTSSAWTTSRVRMWTRLTNFQLIDLLIPFSLSLQNFNDLLSAGVRVFLRGWNTAELVLRVRKIFLKHFSV